MDRFTNLASTTVGVGGISNSATSLPVSSASGFPTYGTYKILVGYSEIMQVTGGQGTTTWAVARGGTTAGSAGENTSQVAHLAGENITLLVSAYDFNNFRQEFNVLAYGAKGDGVTDDTTAINAAITDAAVNGGIVFFPGFIFAHTGTLNFSGGINYRFATGATLKYSGIGDAVSIGNQKRIVWEGGTIDLTGAGSAAIGLHIKGLWFFEMREPRIVTAGSGTQTRILIETAVNAGVLDWGSYVLRIIGPDFATGAGSYGIRTIKSAGGTNGITQLAIEGGWIAGSGYGINLDSCSSFWIRDTTLSGGANDGIFVSNSNNGIISSGEINTYTGWGINFGAGNSGHTVFSPSHSSAGGAAGFMNTATYTPSTYERSHLRLYGSTSDQTYWFDLQSQFNYGQALKLDVNGGGTAATILEYGDVVGLTVRGSANSTPVKKILFDGPIQPLQQIYPAAETLAAQNTGGLLHSTGVPSNANGNNNDWAISDNGSQYFRSGGTWTAFLLGTANTWSLGQTISSGGLKVTGGIGLEGASVSANRINFTSGSNGLIAVGATTVAQLGTLVSGQSKIILSSLATATVTTETPSLASQSDTLTLTAGYAIQRANIFFPPVLNGAVTITSAATLAVSGAPSGTATITNSYALWVQGGLVEFDGDPGLKFGTAISRIVPGATSISLRNNANNADNLILTDAGAATIRAGLTITAGGVAVTAGDVNLSSGNVLFPAANRLDVTAAGTLQIGVTNASQIDLAPTTQGNVNFKYATTALGGGAAPTLGTIGGSGPATAAQNSWLKVLINGTATYIPVWR